MQVSEVRKVVEEWAIDELGENEISSVSESQWELFLTLLDSYLRGDVCETRWSDFIRDQLESAGCSYRNAVMLAWSREKFDLLQDSDCILLGENNTRTAAETQEYLKGQIGQVLGVDHLLNQEGN